MCQKWRCRSPAPSSPSRAQPHASTTASSSSSGPTGRIGRDDSASRVVKMHPDVRSMTGYGRGVAEQGGRRVSVEIRSVNHRFTDVKLRGAQLDPAVEEKIVARVRERVTRGAMAL